MKSFSFRLEEEDIRISIDLPSNLIQQFAAAPRSYSYSGTLPKDWKTSYFQMFLRHAADLAPLEAVLSELRRSGQPRDSEELARLAITFVQNAIAYDWKTAYNLASGKIKYPSETLMDGMGVCADKTILLAALLQRLGFGLAILTWDRANHMALGIKVPAAYGNFGTAYAMVETTGPTAIGQVPERYAGGVKLDGKPEVVEIPGGTGTFQGIAAQRKEEEALSLKYGSQYLVLPPAQQAIFRQMHPLQAEMEALSKQLKGCSGTLQPARFAECQALQQQHNTKVELYNTLVKKFNAAAQQK